MQRCAKHQQVYYQNPPCIVCVMKVRDHLQAKIEQLEGENNAGRRLWIDAQKRCKAQALRGDKLQTENKTLQKSIELVRQSDDCSTEIIGKMDVELEQQAEKIERLRKHIRECMKYRFSALGCVCGLRQVQEGKE